MMQISTSGHKKSPLIAWGICLVASSFFFFSFAQMNIFNSISMKLMSDFHITMAQLGSLSSMFFLGIIVFFIPAGFILDRYPIKIVMCCAMFLSIVMTSLFAITHSFTTAQLVRFISGMMHDIAFLGCFRLVDRWLNYCIGFAMGIIVTIGFSGGMFSQIPFLLLTNYFGWRVSELILVIVALLFLFLLFIFLREPREIILPNKPLLSSFKQDLIPVLKLFQNWICSFYTALLNLPVLLLGALWGNLYIIHVHHLSQVQASVIVGMIYLGIIVGSPIAGGLSDRIGGRVLLMQIGAFFTFISSILTAALPQASFGMLIILFFSLGFFASTETLSYPIITESNPKKMTSLALSFASMSVIGIGALFQPILGYLMDLGNTIHVYFGVNNYSIAFLIIPATSFISLLLTFFIKETYCLSITDNRNLYEKNTT